MTNLHAIPIRREVRGKRGTNLDIAQRILHDINAALAQLAGEGKASQIDLRQVPHMTAETYSYLRDALGRGEVSASITADFSVEVSETAIAGVWWVAHRDADGETVTEIIEITEVPGILRASRGEIRAAALGLAARLAQTDETARDRAAIAIQNPRNPAATEVEA